MNKFKEYNVTTITKTKEQRILENRLKYFWNDKPIRYDIGEDIIRYCHLFDIRCDIEDTGKNNATVSVHTYKIEKDWQEIIKDMVRIDNKKE